MKVTVAICTWNRSALLARVLEHLRSIRIPEEIDWELLVVDNNSTDGTRDLLENLETSLPLHASFEPRQGKTAACNRVLEEAKGEIIAWIDDDVLPDAGWLQAVCQAFDRHAADMVFGPIRPEWLTQPPPWFSRRFDGKFALLDLGPRVLVASEPSQAFFGANYASKVDVLRDLGGFREDIGPVGDVGMDEDMELYLRALRKGKRLVYEPQASVKHMIEGARCDKSFLRRRLWRAGPTYYRLLLESDKDVPRILSIPRYQFRLALDDVVAYCRSLVGRDASAAYHYELKLIHFSGVIWHVLRNKATRRGKWGETP